MQRRGPAAVETLPDGYTALRLGDVLRGLSLPLPFGDGYRRQGPWGKGGQ